MTDIDICNYVQYKSGFTGRVYKVIGFRENGWECLIEDVIYKQSSWWRTDSLELAKRDEFPEYWL